MGGGDLNLKKSWHPGLLSNQRKVYDEEQKALAERKLIEQIRRERAEEREIEELEKLAEDAGGTKRIKRVDWMYSGANAGATGTSEEQESYLLGKRRVDQLLKKSDQLQETKIERVQADPVRDVAAKVALDPMLLIEKQHLEAQEKAAAMEAKIMERASRRDKHDRNSKRSHRHREHRRSHRSRSRHRSKDRSRRDRDRSRSPKERQERRRKDDSDHEHKRYRQRSASRSRSPYRNGRDRDEEKPHKSRRPERSERRRSYSPRKNNDYHRRDNRASPRRDLAINEKETDKSREEERAAKLAAMQADASSLEDDRLRRLEALERRDAEDRERENRRRDNKGGNFKSSLYQQTEGIGLADRLKGSRRTMST
ncbi:hypothetical protein BT63DRAFT_430660 [Microthyrium microscopicum]|uniref:CBF1-interacting co-repressor CIR N-terminal domain-containing protein n=1 Tax=Microthyrium microscopicum TaxID=703497 RepID=A0A6A6TTL4_9PEZI|nr:hypothetical protein BT63DRAFT_430660 [Microthyrium microscopicum]